MKNAGLATDGERRRLALGLLSVLIYDARLSSHVPSNG
jgi:hypothetical protein